MHKTGENRVVSGDIAWLKYLEKHFVDTIIPEND